MASNSMLAKTQSLTSNLLKSFIFPLIPSLFISPFCPLYVWILLKDPPTLYILVLYLQKIIQGFHFFILCVVFHFMHFLGCYNMIPLQPLLGFKYFFFSACVPTTVEITSFRHHSLHAISCFPNQVMVLMPKNIDKNQKPFIIFNLEKKWQNVIINNEISCSKRFLL
jgi:hypothetical protein